MTPDVLKAVIFSLVVHAGLLWGGGQQTQPVVMDVERDLVSVELELILPSELIPPDVAEPAVQPAPPEPSWTDEPPEPLAPSEPSPAVVAGQGALTEASPRDIKNPSPAYPYLARLRGWEGTVILLVRVEPDGRPSRVQVLSSSGHAALDRAARSAVLEWEFVPARRGGRAVSSTVKLPVRFRLTTEGAVE